MRAKAINAVSMAADIESPIIEMSQCEASHVAQFVWTGTPTGNVSVLGSTDGVNFDQLSGATAATGGAPGSAQLNATGLQNFPFIKLKYTFTGGAGTLNAWISARDKK